MKENHVDEIPVEKKSSGIPSEKETETSGEKARNGVRCTTAPSDKKTSNLSSVFELFLVFFKIGAVTFGGGLAMLPILEQELAEKRDWVTKERLLDYFAIGQSTPGIIAVNVATFIGYTRAGVLGGCLATLGVIMPSLIIITIIALFLSGFNDITWVKKALAGINIGVSALLCKAVWKFRKNVTASVLTALLFVLSFISVAFLHVNTVIVVVVSVVCGVATYFVRDKKQNKPDMQDTSVAPAATKESQKTEGGEK